MKYNCAMSNEQREIREHIVTVTHDTEECPELMLSSARRSFVLNAFCFFPYPIIPIVILICIGEPRPLKSKSIGKSLSNLK